MNIGQFVYQLAYEKSPIFLTDGLAQAIPGETLPLIAITQAADVLRGAAGGSIATNLDDFFATFWPMAGAKLVSNQVGQYPFANQKTAANAIIAQALNFSMRMNITPKTKGAMISRTMTMAAFTAAIEKHCQLGGTFTVLTPAKMYVGCILTGMTDMTSGESKHQQTDWQLEFLQPLLNTSEADIVMNSVMDKQTKGLK
jgi:hypothetical protein